jgi:hypothetical protein
VPSGHLGRGERPGFPARFHHVELSISVEPAMSFRFNSHRSVSILLALLLGAGCVSTVQTSALNVTTPPPANPRAIMIDVEAPMPDPLQDQHTLRVALEEAFTSFAAKSSTSATPTCTGSPETWPKRSPVK